MCFETYEGPTPGGKVEQWELMIGFFLDRSGNALSLGEGFVELIAWDRTKRVFNFWELLGSEWFYRGDSNDIAANVANLNLGRPAADFVFTKVSRDCTDVLRCSGCHSLGGPVMKEIAPPFNDWWRTARPLNLGAFDPAPPVKALITRVTDASNLADQVKRGVDRLVAERAGTKLTLQQQVRSLLTTFEMNLASDSVPFQTRIAEATPIEIPSAFFVDQRLVGKPSPIRVDLRAYRAALERLDARFPAGSSQPARGAARVRRAGPFGRSTTGS